MSKKESFITNRLKSISYAFKGAVLLIKTEASIKTQVFIAIIMTIAGFYYQISSTEWILQILAIGLVIGIEGINTAIEAIADFVHPEHHHKIGFIKDIAAGAVFIASVAAVIGGFIIYFPKIF
ncbi:diacylglycerol kinase family protein [Flavobacteriaceae bacterium AU392]|nr:diacylglycerol kinase family protein [Flavobacteriaceae bacterium]RKM86548.1 diacylglycerol kinase family protein [Flavobacteriaceae bacterium AU392]